MPGFGFRYLFFYAADFPDQDTVSGVKLKAGRNVLVVVNGTHSWGGSVRLADAEGRPIPGLSVALSPR